jgi:hypothetical protein
MSENKSGECARLELLISTNCNLTLKAAAESGLLSKISQNSFPGGAAGGVGTDRRWRADDSVRHVDGRSPLKNAIQSNPPREQGVPAQRIHQSFALADAAGYFFNGPVGRAVPGNPSMTSQQAA